MPGVHEWSGCMAAPVNVEIIDVTNERITFQTDARLTSATDQSPPSHRRIDGTFSCHPSEIWTVPKDWPPEKRPVPAPGLEDIRPGARGLLYLCKAALLAPGTSALGACVVRGWYPVPPAPAPHAPASVGPPARPLSDEQVLLFKWPDCQPLDPTNLLRLQPTRIVVEGVTAAGKSGKVDLLDAALAEPAQDLDWNGASRISLRLTPAGLERFAHPPAAAPLAIWPVAIEVSGRSALGHGFSGRVDLRNQIFAGRAQRLQWSGAEPISIRLTDSGFVLFGVLPEDIEDSLQRVVDAMHTDPALRYAFKRVQAATQALELWHDSLAAGQDKRLDSAISGLVMDFLEGP